MNAQSFFDLFSQYGLLLLFVIVFLEYMNLPGLPAGVIMPAAGILVSQSQLNIITAILVSVIAGMLGSYVLYGIGALSGVTVVAWIERKSTKVKGVIDRCMALVDRYGNKGLFICRLIPVLRTIVSIPAGIFRIDLRTFTLYSIPGIFCWNMVLILLGYFFGDVVFTVFV